jgi:hypothetical protein
MYQNNLTKLLSGQNDMNKKLKSKYLDETVSLYKESEEFRHKYAS